MEHAQKGNDWKFILTEEIAQDFGLWTFSIVNKAILNSFNNLNLLKTEKGIKFIVSKNNRSDKYTAREHINNLADFYTYL